MSIVAVVDRGQGSGSTAAFSKCARSPRTSGPLFIDLGIPKVQKNETGNCQHFSIRGYTADMRQKDPSISLLFASDGDISNSEMQCPPMDVPRYRWWGCPGCIQGNGAPNALEGSGAVQNCCETALIPRSICSPTPSNNDMEIVLADVKHVPEVEKFDGKKVDENSSNSRNDGINLPLATDKNGKCSEVALMPMIGPENVEKGVAQEKYATRYLSPYSGKKDNKTEAGHTAVSGHENGSDHDDIHEITNADYEQARDKPNQKERHLHGRVGVESKSISLIEARMPSRSHDAGRGIPAAKFTKSKANISIEAGVNEFNFMDEELGNVLPGCKTSKEASKSNKVIPALNGHFVGHPSDGGNPSSERDGILASNNHRDQKDDSSGGFRRRKNRKVRLLTDLLGGNANSENNRLSTEGSPSNSISDVPSTSASISPVPQTNAKMDGNVGSVAKLPQRKRKMPSDQERKPMKINIHKSGKRAKLSNGGDAKRNVKPIEISDSESEENVDGVAVCNGYKSHGRGRRKNKPTKIGDEHLSLVPWSDVLSKHNHAKLGDASKTTSAEESVLKSKHASITGCGTEQFPKGVVPPQQRERNSSSTKKSSILQVEHRQVLARPDASHVLGEASVKRKDLEPSGAEAEGRKLRLEHDVRANIGLDLSLSSYTPLQRKEKDHTKVEDSNVRFNPRRQVHNDLTKKDGVDVGESSVRRGSTLDPPSTKEILCGISDKVARRIIPLWEQRNYSSQPSNGSCSQHEKMDISDPCWNEKNSGIRLNSDKKPEKRPFAKGSSDEMDIAELMAKYQYERALYPAEKSYSQSKSDNSKRNPNVIAFPKVIENGALPFLQRDYPSTSTRKPPSPGRMIDRIPIGANVAPINRNPANFQDNRKDLFKIGQRETPRFSILDAVSRSQPQASSGIPFSDLGSLWNRNLQNSAMKEKLTSRMPYSANMPFFKSYAGSHNSLPHSDAGYIWSALTPNHMASGQNIPQTCRHESSNVGTHAQFMGPDKGKRVVNFDLNIEDPNGASIEEQNKRACAEYPFLPKKPGMELNPKGKAPLDASDPNETIPAMQLLSLMNAAVPSHKSFSVDGKNLLEKPFSPCSNHPTFSVGGNPNFLEKPLFPNFAIRPGPGESSRDVMSANVRNKHLTGKSSEYPPAVPVVNPFASVSRNLENVKRAPRFTGQVHDSVQEQERAKGSYSLANNQGCRLEKSSISPAGELRGFGGLNPGKGKQKVIPGSVNPLVYSFQRQANNDPSKCINLGPRITPGTVRPMPDESRDDVCTVNRNPADFSSPEPGNEYMISGEDLKVRKKFSSRGKSFLENINGRKKQRVAKTRPADERAQ